MCNFFSFETEPEMYGGQRFYFDWEYRKAHLPENDADSHDHIEKFYKLPKDKCNKYEFNPLTKKFTVDQINSPVDDRIQAEDWVRKLDFKNIVEPLLIKEIINPFELKMIRKPTKAQIALLKDWASVRDSVWASVWDSVRASVWASVGDYISTFITADYKYDFSPSNRLWESGLVPSFDGIIWRLHSGKNAKIVYEISAEELRK